MDRGQQTEHHLDAIPDPLLTHNEMQRLFWQLGAGHGEPEKHK